MSYQELRTKYPNIRTNILAFHALKCSLPRMWANYLSSENYRPLTQTEREKPYEIKIGENWVLAKETKSKHYYWDQLPKQTPSGPPGGP